MTLATRKHIEEPFQLPSDLSSDGWLAAACCEFTTTGWDMGPPVESTHRHRNHYLLKISRVAASHSSTRTKSTVLEKNMCDNKNFKVYMLECT